MVNPTVLEIFYQHFCAKALVWVNPIVLELFYQHFCAKALVLVNPTVLEIFYRNFCANALVLVNSTISRSSLIGFVHIIHDTKAVLLPNWSYFTIVEIR